MERRVKGPAEAFWPEGKKQPMESAFSREELLLGPEALERLRGRRVAVFGLGGVGGHAAEAMVRCGVGALSLIDGDEYALSNLNRQLFATGETIGMPKVQAAAERLRQINPQVELETYHLAYTSETAGQLDFTRYDYILDAIDMVTGKLAIIERAYRENIPVVSAMGAGNKLDPTAFRVADIYETSVCPLARVMRRELKKRGVDHLKVVYSQEPPISVPVRDGEKPIPGSVAFVPPVVGLIMAGEAVKDLCGIREQYPSK